MSSSSASLDLPRTRALGPRRRLPRVPRLMGALLSATLALLLVSTYLHLEVPRPSGTLPVGRTKVSWVDEARPERHTPDPSDNREVPALVWYPARPETGAPASYVSDLPRIRDALIGTGEVNALEATGLKFVRDAAREGAAVSSAQDNYPLIVLSPGNLTNVSFYSSLAEDLASNGYIVVGIDHPYSVAAVQLSDGSVATPRTDALSPEMVTADIDQRVADIRWVVDRATSADPTFSFLQGKIDVSRIAVMGHSLGGIAAVEACRKDPRLVACLNLDGQQAGGPFSTDPEGVAPDQAFMYLTKETALHPKVLDRFETAGKGAFIAVLPAASHDSFADGSLFEPSLVPWARTRDSIITTARGITLAFFEHALRGAPVEVLGAADARTDVFMNVFPLGDNPPLPR